MTETPLQLRNFWDKVNKDGPVPPHKPELGQCWLWTGKLRKNGYGMAYNMATGKEIRAHRAAYIITFGQPNLGVCHHCDNPSCVRPSHLFDGSQKANMRDALKKGRLKSHLTFLKLWEGDWKNRIGENGVNAKLKEWEAIQILKLKELKLGSFRIFSNIKLAAMFGISRATINDIGKNSWRHLIEPHHPPQVMQPHD